jgi:post-segregation antitoxin (ccd killing protein)
MAAVKIFIELSEELVERAKAVGLNIENQSDVIAEAVEKEIRRLEVGKNLREIAEQLRAMPDELKPTSEEIDEAVRQARAEIATERKEPRRS